MHFSDELFLPEIYPNPEQLLLLRAATLPHEEALIAFAQWKSQVKLSVLDDSSVRVLPLLYHHLKDSLANDPVLEGISSQYLRIWGQNQLRLQTAVIIINALQAQGCRIMLLKGLALGLVYYESWGARPMADIDLMVPFCDASRAISVLQEMGWQKKLRPKESSYQYSHAWSFVNAKGQECDLHWHLLANRCYESADRDFWNGAKSVKFQDLHVSVLNPTDQVFHICLHGFQNNITRPIYWVADALIILRKHAKQIEWEKLSLKAKALSVAPFLSYSLDFISKEFNAEIPGDLIDSLRQVSLSKWDRIEFETYVRHSPRFSERNFLQVLRILYLQYRLFGRTCGFTGKWKTFFHYLRHLKGGERCSHLVVRATKVILRWCRKRSLK